MMAHENLKREKKIRQFWLQILPKLDLAKYPIRVDTFIYVTQG